MKVPLQPGFNGRGPALPEKRFLISYAETAAEKEVPLLEVQRGFADVLRTRAEPGMWVEVEGGWVKIE